MAALTNDQILDAIASMSVLEASELVKAMEEKFGVTAAVAVAAGPAAGGAAGGAADDEQTEFAVSLDSFDAAKKIGVIKAVKALTNLGLGEAKALVEGAPKVLKGLEQGRCRQVDCRHHSRRRKGFKEISLSAITRGCLQSGSPRFVLCNYLLSLFFRADFFVLNGVSVCSKKI